jgi:hypothetical protein
MQIKHAKKSGAKTTVWPHDLCAHVSLAGHLYVSLQFVCGIREAHAATQLETQPRANLPCSIHPPKVSRPKVPQTQTCA